MQIKSLFVLASLAVASLAEVPFTQVHADIHEKMASAVTDFDKDVHSFPFLGGKRRQAM
ncbi:hypothetical protein C0993_012493, partial [Termitomyces sp. T159_Od127]